MCLLGIKKTRTTSLHPQSDQVERQHRKILNYLSKYISENEKDWNEWIFMCLLACRTFKHEATGATPAKLYFARDLRLYHLIRYEVVFRMERKNLKGAVFKVKN